MKEAYHIKGILFFLAFTAVSIYFPAFARAAETAPGNIALYEGADREQRLLVNAKKEGTLTYYTTMPAGDAKVVTADFEKKYGVMPAVSSGI